MNSSEWCTVDSFASPSPYNYVSWCSKINIRSIQYKYLHYTLRLIFKSRLITKIIYFLGIMNALLNFMITHLIGPVWNKGPDLLSEAKIGALGFTDDLQKLLFLNTVKVIFSMTCPICQNLHDLVC